MIHHQFNQKGTGTRAIRSALPYVPIEARHPPALFPTSPNLFRPHTGRRHQLRLHTLHIGHPILGDATYAGDNDDEPERMCLHAHSLRLQMAPPVASAPHDTMEIKCSVEEVPFRRRRRQQIDAEGEFDCILQITAPDPFQFVDGELRL